MKDYISLSFPESGRMICDKIGVGVLGYGNVGSGILEYYLRSSEPVLDALEIVAVGVQDLSKERGIPFSSHVRTLPRVTNKPLADIVNNPSIDVVIDAVGGNAEANAASKKYLYRALENGKHVVTCNKAVLCEELVPLTELANGQRVNLRYEAAVCGGIPIIQTLQDYYARDDIIRVSGIINGTSNYILTQMHKGKTFNEALSEAQHKGFAEADPRNDVEGYDALHKLVLLASIAFRTQINLKDVLREGIQDVSHQDIYYLQNILGPASGEHHAIKLIASAEKRGSTLDLRLHPMLISSEHPLYGVDGAMNAISVYGKYLGPQTFRGLGAGSHPTAFAVMADLFEVIARIKSGTHKNFSDFSARYTIERDPVTSGYFRSISPEHESRVFATKCDILGRHGLDIYGVHNFPRTFAEGSEELVPDIICIESAREQQIRRAREELTASPCVRGKVVYVREDL